MRSSSRITLCMSTLLLLAITTQGFSAHAIWDGPGTSRFQKVWNQERLSLVEDFEARGLTSFQRTQLDSETRLTPRDAKQLTSAVTVFRIQNRTTPRLGAGTVYDVLNRIISKTDFRTVEQLIDVTRSYSDWKNAEREYHDANPERQGGSPYYQTFFAQAFQLAKNDAEYDRIVNFVGSIPKLEGFVGSWSSEFQIFLLNSVSGLTDLPNPLEVTARMNARFQNMSPKAFLTLLEKFALLELPLRDGELVGLQRRLTQFVITQLQKGYTITGPDASRLVVLFQNSTQTQLPDGTKTSRRVETQLAVNENVADLFMRILPFLQNETEVRKLSSGPTKVKDKLALTRLIQNRLVEIEMQSEAPVTKSRMQTCSQFFYIFFNL